MRLPVALALSLLVTGAVRAEPSYTADELPLPFGREVERVRLSEGGMVVGCMERGENDWLPFAWHAARGLRLIDGGVVGDRYRCSVSGVSANGLVAGTIPTSGWIFTRPFLWSEADGLTLFDPTPRDAGPRLNAAGQLALAGIFGGLRVWSESEGFTEIEIGDGYVESIRQNEVGLLWGQLDEVDTRSFFVWSRERGFESFLERPYSDYYPTLEHFSVDGWAAGYLDPSNASCDSAYVRAPDGTLYPFTVDGSLDVEIRAIGRDGLVVGSALDERWIDVAYVFQPGFGVEVLSRGISPTTFDSANGVSASNVVVGQATNGHAVNGDFVWERGKGIERIGRETWAGPFTSSVINDTGWVLGALQRPGPPYLWSRATGALELSWDGANPWRIFAFLPDANGTVIGWGEDAPGVNRPFVFMPRIGMLDPLEWLPVLAAGSVVPHYSRNAAGQFLIHGNDPVDGRRRWFLLTPVGPTNELLDLTAVAERSD